MTFIVPRPTDARARPSVSLLVMALILAAESTACVCVGCGNAPPATPRAEDPPPAWVAPRDDERSFTTDDGWSFVAPKAFERSTAPGTTGFAVYRPPPAKPNLNIVLTTEGFDGNVSAFVDKERAKIKIVKEQPSGFGVAVEETWRLGDDENGVALVLLAVQDGVGIRLACLGSDKDFESQRPICERAIASLHRLRKTP
jgi:hypothetical protein